MKRGLIVAAVVSMAALVAAVVSASAGNGNGRSNGGASIHVIERATTDAVTNGNPDVDTAGNVLTFANDVFNESNTRKVGSDQGYCIRIVVGKTWECNFTTFLKGGQITAEGPFSDSGNTVLAITGGTGKYRNARGSMDLEYHNAAGTAFDFVFHLHGGD